MKRSRVLLLFGILSLQMVNCQTGSNGMDEREEAPVITLKYDEEPDSEQILSDIKKVTSLPGSENYLKSYSRFVNGMKMIVLATKTGTGSNDGTDGACYFWGKWDYRYKENLADEEFQNDTYQIRFRLNNPDVDDLNKGATNVFVYYVDPSVHAGNRVYADVMTGAYVQNKSTDMWKCISANVRESNYFGESTSTLYAINAKVQTDGTAISPIVSSGNSVYLDVYRNSMPEIITVMTYNVRRNGSVDSDQEDGWDKRRNRVLQLITNPDNDSLTDDSPDIILLQEVKVDNSQLSFFVDNLTNYSHKEGKSNDHWEAVPVFYKKNKFRKISNGSLNVGESVVGSWDRCCTFVLLETIDSKIPFYVFNTHFTAGSSSIELSHRLKSAIDIRTLFGNEGVTSDDGYDGLCLNNFSRIILGGDLNSKKSGDAYRHLTNNQSGYSYSWALQDGFLAVNPGTTYDTNVGWNFECQDAARNYCSNWTAGSDQRIDYVFTSLLGVKTVDSRIITFNNWSTCDIQSTSECRNRASDHDPVLSTIILE